jgi:hypothetical protein
MIADDVHEIRGMVSALPALRPDAARAARVRALGRSRLERGHRRSRNVSTVALFGRHVVAPAIAAGLFALYAADLLSITLRAFTV